MKFYNTSQFRRLNKEWRKKLKRSGFEDIEHESGTLKNCASLRIPQLYDSFTEEYYRRCRQYLANGEFTSKYERKVWELHSEGLNSRQIAVKAGKTYDTAWRTVCKVEERMNKLKLWLRDCLPVELV